MNTHGNIERSMGGGVASIPALRDAARGLEPVLRIGKNGLTPGAVQEIIAQLKKKHLIKVKLLSAFLDGKDKKIVAVELAAKTDATLVQLVGNVVVLYRKG